MRTQPTLFGHASTSARQTELFPRGGRVSALSCEVCGEALEHTPGGYLACPNGHGRLQLAQVPDAEPSGLWIEEELWNS